MGCNCNSDFDLKHLSWKRIRDGQAAQQEKYGVSLVKVNWMAKMANTVLDPGVAEKADTLIGDNWDEDTWKTRKSFDLFRSWVENYSAGKKW